MILIKKRQTNEVVVTLKERQTIANPAWIFLFTNDITNEQTIFTATDTSMSCCRYNSFTIEESTSVNLYQGVVNLQPGFYSYTVFESVMTSPVVLDVTGLRACELGKVLVIDQDVPDDAEYTGGDNQTNYVFNG